MTDYSNKTKYCECGRVMFKKMGSSTYECKVCCYARMYISMVNKEKNHVTTMPDDFDAARLHLAIRTGKEYNQVKL